MPIAPRMNRGNYSAWDEAILPFIKRELVPKSFPSYAELQDISKKKGPITPEQISNFAVDMASPFAKIGGLLGQTVWHGSPFRWMKPDISKIGTGEGAQYYGHGFYSAESPDVAKNYMFSGRTEKEVKDRIDFLGKAIKTKKSPFTGKQIPEVDLDYYKQSLQKELDSLKSSTLYKLDIPDEKIKNYLSWDETLEKQPNNVKKLFGKKIDKKKTGQELYNELLKDKNNDPLKVSNFLNDMGVPGISYFDQFSREAGKTKTKNYVTFDPSTIEVLEKIGRR